MQIRPWECRTCTYNHEDDVEARLLACKVCEAKRDDEHLPPSVVEAEQQVAINQYATGFLLRGLPNSKFLRVCLDPGLDAAMRQKFSEQHEDDILSNCCWVISAVWMLVSVDAFQDWERDQFPELFDVMAALTQPVGGLHTASVMMQLLVKLLLSDPIASIINTSLKDGLVINDPSEFVDAVLKNVKELDLLTRMTRKQTSERTCGCLERVLDGTDRLEQDTTANIVVVGAGDLGTSDHQVSTLDLWNVAYVVHKYDATCRAAGCRGGEVRRWLDEPENLPRVLMFQLSRLSIRANDLRLGGKCYKPSVTAYIKGQQYDLKSWSDHAGYHHACGVVAHSPPPFPLRMYTVDGNSELRIASIGMRELPPLNGKSTVSFAVYERTSDTQSRLPALIPHAIRFKDGLLKIVEETKPQRSKKTKQPVGVGDQSVGLRKSNRVCRKIKLFSPA